MHKNRHQVVCFGEVLWDILPSGAVPGGAPMNVTYHLHKQNKNPGLITRIGDDEKGKELLNIFSNHGVCTDFFQVDQVHETGKVYATADANNEVVYDIVKPVAWDFIEWQNEYEDLISNSTYFVFGSLAARSKASKNTLLRLLENAKNKVLDINLRTPHFDKAIVEELLLKANILKLNLAELELISNWFGNYNVINDRVQLVADKFNIPIIVITMGGNGALLYIEGEFFAHSGFKVNVTDTVGSGDAFLAGLLIKLIEDDEPQKALEFANALGALIATKRGACPNYRNEEIIAVMQQS